MLDTVAEKKIKQVLESYPERMIFSNRKQTDYDYRKTVIRKMVLRGEMVYQIERYTDKQVFHENLSMDKMCDVVFEIFPSVYSQMNVFGETGQWDYKVTKKGKLLANFHKMKSDSVKKISVEGELLPANNRRKRYIIQEGMVVPPLMDLGIFTKDGKVVDRMYDKFKQINRFLELVEDVVKDYPNKNMQIIDFGCGKSYLTFILYYYLVEIRHYPVHITGLDLKEDVICHCRETAKKYGYDNLHFDVGDINGYETTQPIDMVVTLHACDTATDYALYNAIKWNAGIILSVPCCQKEVNGQIESRKLSLLTRYGIVKERMSALITDAVRGNVLEYCGYKTQLLEFVDFASSPKNILIRAVRGNISEKKREKAKKEILSLMEEFQFDQTLVTLMGIKE